MNLSSKKLYQLCKKYGQRARLWHQKFAGLLPEVYRRRLFEKKGYGSIYEFAAKLAGMSKEQVNMVLNLERRFDDKPILKNLLETGEVSVNKLARVVSVATSENQERLAEQVKLLPKAALDTYVKDLRDAENENQNGLFKPNFAPKGLLGQTGIMPKTTSAISEFLELELSAKVTEKLLELKRKGIDINELLLKFLNHRELEIARAKEEISGEMEVQTEEHTTGTNGAYSKEQMDVEQNRILKEHGVIASGRISRYIPVKIRKILKKEYGTKCSIATCQRDARHIHHTQRFSLSKNHNPHFLAPLCGEHHVIAHSIDMKFHARRRLL